jgi:hypothetical protein
MVQRLLSASAFTSRRCTARSLLLASISLSASYFLTHSDVCQTQNGTSVRVEKKRESQRERESERVRKREGGGWGGRGGGGERERDRESLKELLHN